jgi:nucleotide-binding universal stress UspA family protein
VSEQVVVGVSGAPADEPALAWAVDECRRRPARLVIAHACTHAESGAAGHPGLTAAVDDARQALGADQVDVRVGPRPAGPALLGLVGPRDLLVVGPPSRTGWTHWDSTTQYVARHAPCPLVVVRPSRVESRAAFPGHVVVGYDGSVAARAALAFAVPYAAGNGARLVAVTVNMAALAPWPLRQDFRFGQPGPAILDAARGARLLVLGAHAGRPGRRIRLGSTSLDAISRATGPVAILPMPSV